MEYTGQLVTGDFGDNTMTFKIDGEMTLQAGKYKIVQIEVGNGVENNVDLADVGERKPTYNDGLRDELTLLKEKRDAALGSNAIRYWEREIKRVKKKLYG